MNAQGQVHTVSSRAEPRAPERGGAERDTDKVIVPSPQRHSKMVKNSLGQAAGARSRAAAALIVDAVSSGVSLGEAFPRYLQDFDERDVSFIKEMVYGTLRQRRLLLNTLKPLCNYKITERHRIVQALLIVALYQLTFMRVPAHAVVASTVSACADIERKGFTALVNAILRRFLREGGQLAQSGTPAVDYSFPDWLYQKIADSYPERCSEILAQSNEKAPLFLRVELSKTTREQLLAQLAAAGIEAQAGALYQEIAERAFAANLLHETETTSQFIKDLNRLIETTIADYNRRRTKGEGKPSTDEKPQPEPDEDETPDEGTTTNPDDTQNPDEGTQPNPDDTPDTGEDDTQNPDDSQTGGGEEEPDDRPVVQ